MFLAALRALGRWAGGARIGRATLRVTFWGALAMALLPVLEPDEIRAPEYPLDDEHNSYETYAQVIRDFGDVRSFINIVEAEQRHFTALLSLFETCGLAPSPNRWTEHAPRFDSAHAACVAAVQGKIDTVKLDERALTTTQHPDILAVCVALRSASLDRHLPAFRRCTEGGDGGRGGRRRPAL